MHHKHGIKDYLQCCQHVNEDPEGVDCDTAKMSNSTSQLTLVICNLGLAFCRNGSIYRQADIIISSRSFSLCEVPHCYDDA